MQLYKLMFPNGKSYIGITSKTAKERFIFHCTPSAKQYPCQRAINKYGKKNVKINVIAECEDYELLLLAEREAIEKFDTTNPSKGYNVTIGGEGWTVLKGTEEDKILHRKEVSRKCKKEWADRNKEKVRASARNYANKKYNKDKVLSAEKAKEWRLNNPEKVKAIAKKSNSTEKRRQAKKEWNLANPDKVKESEKKRRISKRDRVNDT